MVFSTRTARQGVTGTNHPVARVLVVSTLLTVVSLGFVTFLT